MDQRTINLVAIVVCACLVAWTLVSCLIGLRVFSILGETDRVMGMAREEADRALQASRDLERERQLEELRRNAPGYGWQGD
jgi:hypothetical protein